MYKTQFYEDLSAAVAGLGGYHNAHLHLDRSHTLGWDAAEGGGGLAAYGSLQQKHGLIDRLHASSAYTYQSLQSRGRRSLDVMVACQTRRADTLADVTPDRVGLTALEALQDLAPEYARQGLRLNVAAYCPFGFRKDQTHTWDLLEKGAQTADFIAGLPERDDQRRYPDHIGYQESCTRLIDLAKRTGKFLHLHTDQANVSDETGTEELLEVVERDGTAVDANGDPLIWIIHMISPTRYDEPRWSRLVERLQSARVGVICCPSAALGMRQIRPHNAPTDNSIARVLDLGAAGVPVRLGSDNLADMLSPSTTPDLSDEVMFLSAALRFYDIPILAHLACGRALQADHVAFLKDHLEQNHVEMAKTAAFWRGQPA